MLNPVGQRGFTLVEIISVMVLAGILASIAIPRMFNNNTFQTRGFSDEVISTVRYAQSIAIAQNGCANVVFTNTSLTVTIAPSVANVCGAYTPLCFTGKTGQTCSGAAGMTNVIDTPSNITISTLPTPTSFYFDPLGRPVGISTTQTVTVTGDSSSHKFFIEAETGYVHSS